MYQKCMNTALGKKDQGNIITVKWKYFKKNKQGVDDLRNLKPSPHY